MACAHTVRLLLTRRSSACWDTVEEFILLAKTSESVPKNSPLKNTSAGTRLFRTMALKARIRVGLVGENTPREEKLQLLIEDNVLCDDGTKKVENGKPY